MCELAIINWNPEKESVKILKDAIDNLEDRNLIFEDAELLSSLWAEKYIEFSYSAVSEFFCVIAVDSDGYCVFGDLREVKHVSELEADYKNWIKEQEAKNAVKN